LQHPHQQQQQQQQAPVMAATTALLNISSIARTVWSVV